MRRNTDAGRVESGDVVLPPKATEGKPEIVVEVTAHGRAAPRVVTFEVK